MRITLVIDDDVLDKAKALATKLRAPFRHVVNEALRTGLQIVEDTQPQTRPYHTRPHKMGLKAWRNLDNIQTLLSQIEEEDHRWSLWMQTSSYIPKTSRVLTM